jgi:hypothetical protein
MYHVTFFPFFTELTDIILGFTSQTLLLTLFAKGSESFKSTQNDLVFIFTSECKEA